MTNRRTFLTTAAGALAGTLGVVTGAEPARAAGDVARPRVRRLSGSGPGLRVEQSAFALSHLVVGWRGDTAPGVRVRTSAGWRDWDVVRGCHGGRDGGSPVPGSWGLLTTPGATGYEVSGGSGLTVVELDTRSGPRPAAPARLPLAGSSLPYLSRAAWGADESLRYNADGSLAWGPTQYFPVQTLTVHHTAGANDDPDPAATVRAIYYYDAITQGWGDMGYHLLIDEAGRVYEGRWSGDDPVPVFGPDPAPDGRPLMVTGAHVAGYNSGNVGVVLLGDFTDRLPTAAARRTLTAVLAVLSAVDVLDPLGITNYVNPVNGVTATVSTICGHRDWAATQCPGNLFYPHLPEVRTAVARALHRS